MDDKVKLRDANEVDVIVDCPCGTSFYVYLPNTPYKCPECHKLYKIKLSVRHVQDKNPWGLLGWKVNE